MKPIQIFVNHEPYSDDDFKQYLKEGNKFEIDIDFYLFIRVLEHNDDFVNWIKKLRKETKIPENGFDWKANPLLLGFDNIKDVDKKYLYSFKKKEFKYLLDMLPFQYKFSIDEIDWADLIVSNAIRLPFAMDVNLKILPTKSFLEREENYSFEITFKRNFNKVDLLRLIEQNWEWMKFFIPKKQKVDDKSFRLKERDIFLLDQRDCKKLPFREISDNMSKKYPRTGVSYTEDNAKNTYHRAKVKAQLLFSEKNKIDIDSKIFSEVTKNLVR